MARKTLVQVRRDTAANWTSANPTLAAGEWGFETNTGKTKIGDGSTAWSSLSYFVPGVGAGGGVATDVIWDAKGDLAGGTGADSAARLAVGANGLALVADSGETTGLKWAGVGLLAFFQQTAGTNQTTTSASLADVDATNAAVTFTAPPNGKVMVRVTAECQTSNAVQNSFFGLRESTTNIFGPTFIAQGIAAVNTEHLVQWVAYLSGISAGSHTYKLAYSVNGGATLIVRQIGSASTTHPVTIEVWAVP